MTRDEKLSNATELERLLREIVEESDVDQAAVARRQLVLVRRLIRSIKRSR